MKAEIATPLPRYVVVNLQLPKTRIWIDQNRQMNGGAVTGAELGVGQLTAVSGHLAGE